MKERVVKFGLVGVAATVTYYVVSLTMTLWMSVFWANLFGYGVAVFVSYYGHHRVTFAAARTAAGHRLAMTRFAAATLLSLAASQGTLYFAVRVLSLPDWLGLAMVVMVVPLISFVLFQFWVFAPCPRERKPAPSTSG